MTFLVLLSGNLTRSYQSTLARLAHFYALAIPQEDLRYMPRLQKITKATCGDSQSNGANLGFEATLWAAADALRDTLLPKLIYGELRVKDAEKSIYKAAE